MVYSTISLFVVLIILRQTFDPTVLQTKASSQAQRSSQQPLTGPRSPRSPGSEFTTQKIISPGVLSSTSGTDRGSTFQAAQEYELSESQRGTDMLAPGYGGSQAGMSNGGQPWFGSPAPTAEGGGGGVLDSQAGSSVGHGYPQQQQQHEWRMNGSRRPVPEL